MSAEEISAYKTISFGTPVSGTDNAMVLHDPALALCIGLVHSFDGKHGYGWVNSHCHMGHATDTLMRTHRLRIRCPDLDGKVRDLVRP